MIPALLLRTECEENGSAPPEGHAHVEVPRRALPGLLLHRDAALDGAGLTSAVLRGPAEGSVAAVEQLALPLHRHAKPILRMERGPLSALPEGREVLVEPGSDLCAEGRLLRAVPEIHGFKAYELTDRPVKP